MPLPNTSVIPEGWSFHHQETVKSTMRSKFFVYGPSSGAVGGDSELSWPPPGADFAELVAVVWGRVNPLGNNDSFASSSIDTKLQQYLVQVPVGGGVDFQVGDRGHWLKLVENPENPRYVGYSFRPVAYPVGTESFNGNLICVVNLGEKERKQP